MAWRDRLNAQERKERPLCTGVLDYFPDALLEVAYCSYIGNQQHNPGEPLHWAKEKSTDEPDAEARHMLDRKGRDKDGVRHKAKKAWRALADLQRELDAEEAGPPIILADGFCCKTVEEAAAHEDAKRAQERAEAVEESHYDALSAEVDAEAEKSVIPENLNADEYDAWYKRQAVERARKLDDEIPF